MLCRLLRLRAFKPWAKYRAEKLGMTVEQVAEMQKQKTAGAYNEWKDQVIAEGRINFILDHVPAAEQAGFLKEFSTKELANYVLDNIRDMDEASLKKLVKMNVTHSVLPGVNGLLATFSELTKESMLENENVKEKHRLANAAKHNLTEKLKELAWKEADAAVVKSDIAKA